MAQVQPKRKISKKNLKQLKKINKSLKYMGLICGYTTAIQSLAYTFITIAAIIFFAVDRLNSKTLPFKAVYFSLEVQSTTPACVVKPVFLLIIVILYFLISLAWLYISIRLIIIFTKWESLKEIKKLALIWILYSSVICALDLLVFVLFLGDIFCISEYQKFEHEIEHLDKSDKRYIRYQQMKLKMLARLASKSPFLQKLFDNTIPITDEYDDSNDTETSETEEEEYPVLKHKSRKNSMKPFKATTHKGSNGVQEGFKGIPAVLPTVVIMTFVLRGYIFWVANIILTVLFTVNYKENYRRKSVMTLQVVKKRVYYDTS